MWITVKIEWNSRFEIENNDLGSKKEQNERQRLESIRRNEEVKKSSLEASWQSVDSSVTNGTRCCYKVLGWAGKVWYIVDEGGEDKKEEKWRNRAFSSVLPRKWKRSSLVKEGGGASLTQKSSKVHKLCRGMSLVRETLAQPSVKYGRNNICS